MIDILAQHKRERRIALILFVMMGVLLGVMRVAISTPSNEVASGSILESR
ncbi:MAG: hypothetical protein VCD00_07690 [Candidatus Hydrogenedentota bacterium]